MQSGQRVGPWSFGLVQQFSLFVESICYFGQLPRFFTLILLAFCLFCLMGLFESKLELPVPKLELPVPKFELLVPKLELSVSKLSFCNLDLSKHFRSVSVMEIMFIDCELFVFQFKISFCFPSSSAPRPYLIG